MTTHNVTPKIEGRERRDAARPIELVLRSKDTIDAVPKDPHKCIYAKGLQRLYVDAWVGSSTAYVVFKNEPDVAYRYLLSAKDAKRVREFDDNADAVRAAATWIDGVVVTLLPPPVSQQLGYKAGKSGTNKRSGKERQKSHRHLSFSFLDHQEDAS